jgi:hypothetical protein
MSNPEMKKRKILTETKTRIDKTLDLLNKVGFDKFEENRMKHPKSFYKLTTLISKMKWIEEYNVSSLKELELSDLYTYNHKVLKVEKYEATLDVYDIEVPGTHNFALGSGIFVHNSAKQGRDRYFQAILPLKGKIVNTEKAKKVDILKNDEIKSLITALGCGIEENCDLEKLRYGKVIIQTDADIDGKHIFVLIKTAFNTLFKPVLEKGHIYIAVPPLHRAKKGQDITYLKDDLEKKKFIEKIKKPFKNKMLKSIDTMEKTYSLGEKTLLAIALDILKDDIDSAKEKVQEFKIDANIYKELNQLVLSSKESSDKELNKYVFNRFKGLGEMNPDQLAETTMTPETRQIIQLKPEKTYDVSNIFDLEDEDTSIDEVLSEIDDRKKRMREDSTVDFNSLIKMISGDGNKATEFRKQLLYKSIEDTF